MKNKPLLGAHVTYTKENQLLQTINDLISINATSGAMYISNSRGYSRENELNMEKIDEGKNLAIKHNINIENIIVHSPLIGNLANIEKENGIHELTLNSYYNNLVMMEEVGLKYFNFHPGSSPKKELAIKQISDSINELHTRTKDHKTVLLLETMMHKGNYIGKNFEELKLIIDGVKNKDRVGVCIDTCHIWDAGYDIKNNLNKVLKEFDSIIGLHYLKALHINDSKNELGSGKDRHEAIGEGFIGLKALKELVHHKKLRSLPKALETPYGKDDILRWKKEINLLI